MPRVAAGNRFQQVEHIFHQANAGVMLLEQSLARSRFFSLATSASWYHLALDNNHLQQQQKYEHINIQFILCSSVRWEASTVPAAGKPAAE